MKHCPVCKSTKLAFDSVNDIYECTECGHVWEATEPVNVYE